MRRIALPMFLGGCAFLGGLLGAVLVFRGLSPAYAQGVASPGRGEVDHLGERFELVARKVSPAVVAVEAVKPAPPGGKRKTLEESGSGIVVRWPNARGSYVLTNNHVIAQATPAQITVTLADSRVLRPAQVLADPESDVALLRLEGIDDVPPVVLGDSDGVRVGQFVLAFGSPFGLNQTVTHGIISARERGQVSLGANIRIKDFLQTDAAINPGSSGGPLVNLDGEVIGINTAIASHSGNNSGVSFSIPINLARGVARELLEKGSVTRGYLGVQVAAAFEAADALKLGLDRAQGALVERVHPGSPAETAGLRAGDVVLQIDGAAVRNENHFINLISALPAGRRVRLTVWRERRTLPLEAVVGDWAQAQKQLQP
jgi:S1-C subfamily serine protease